MRFSTTNIVAVLLLSGCSNVFLQPDRALHGRPDRVGAVWEEAHFPSSDGTVLTGLWFPSRSVPSKAVVVHFHGNGENMTSHFLFVYWLALEGYDVLAFDYRGYGASQGKKSLSGSVSDGAAALAYARGRAEGKPLIVLGQSLGATLAVAALDRDGGDGVVALIADSTFASYRGIARDKLSLLWLTRFLKWPLSGLVTERYAPRRFLSSRKPVPLLVLHAKGDPVVPYAQGRAFYAAAAGPKEFWEVPGTGHTEALAGYGAEFRPRLLKWLDAALSGRASPSRGG